MKVIISCLKIVFKQVVNLSKHLFSSIPNLQLSEEGIEKEGAVRFKGDYVGVGVLTGIAFSPRTQRERDKNCSAVMGKELWRMPVLSPAF